MKLNRSFALSILSVTGFTAVSANLFSQGQGQGQGQGGDHPSNNGRRVGRLGAKTSTSASSADCATGLDIQLYEDSEILTFSASVRACRSGKAYAGATANGKYQITLVPGEGADGSKSFTASVNDVETGAVYSIGPDGYGDMTVVERYQEDYGEELDPVDERSPEERRLVDEAHVLHSSDDSSSSSKVVDFASGLRGKVVANQFKDLGDQYLAERQGVRDLQAQNTIIDVLVLWTAYAECRKSGLSRGCTRTATTEANMRALINLAVAETNTAYAESGVNVELNLIHAYYTTYIENTFDQALSDLRGTTDGFIDDVHVKRAEHGADVVAMIIDDSAYCGIAYMGPSKANMFSVTYWSCATGYYSFGHEIGHNMGCHHDRGTTNSCTSTNYNFGWRDPTSRFRSILAYNCVSGQCDNNAGASCTRVQRFSNPNFTYNNYPIGNAQNDNARVLNLNRDVVAGYYARASATPAPTKSPQPPSSSPTAPPTTSLQPTSPTVTKYSCSKFKPADAEICANGSLAGGTCSISGESCGTGGKVCWSADGCSAPSGSPPAPTPTPPPPTPTGGCPVCAATSSPCCDTCIVSGKPSSRGCFK